MGMRPPSRPTSTPRVTSAPNPCAPGLGTPDQRVLDAPGLPFGRSGAAAWDVVATALLDELQQRLGGMRSLWLRAEVHRLRSVLRGGAIDRTEALRRLADLQPSTASDSADITKLLARVEEIIRLCDAPQPLVQDAPPLARISPRANSRFPATPPRRPAA